jgi:hypothetical protein
LSVQYCYFKDDTDWNTFIGKATYEPQAPALCYGQIPDPFPNGDRVAETGAIFFDFDFNGRGTMIRGNTFTGFMDGTKASAAPNEATDVSYTQECDVFDNLIDGGPGRRSLSGDCAFQRPYFAWPVYKGKIRAVSCGDRNIRLSGF